MATVHHRNKAHQYTGISSILKAIFLEMHPAQGALVTMALGLTMGVIVADHLAIVAQGIDLIARYTTIFIGTATLWFLKHGKREDRWYLGIATVMMILAALITTSFRLEHLESLLISSSHLVLILTIFVVALKGHRASKH